MIEKFNKANMTKAIARVIVLTPSLLIGPWYGKMSASMSEALMWCAIFCGVSFLLNVLVTKPSEV